MLFAQCDGDRTATFTFPLSAAPFFGFGPALAYHARGAIVANAVALAAAVPLGLAAGGVINVFTGRRQSIVACARSGFFPGTLGMAFAFVGGGTMMGGAALAVHGAWHAVDPLLAAVAIAFVVAAVALGVAAVRHTLAHAVLQPCHLRYTGGGVVFADAAALPARLARHALFGGEFWFPRDAALGAARATFALEHFGVLLSQFHARGVAPYFFVIEASVTMAMCFAIGLIPLNCGAIAVAVAAINFLMLLLAIAVRPYTVLLKNALSVAADLLTAVATALVAVAIHSADAVFAARLVRAGAGLCLVAINVTLLSCGVSAVRFAFLLLWRCELAAGAAGRRGAGANDLELLLEAGGVELDGVVTEEAAPAAAAEEEEEEASAALLGGGAEPRASLPVQ
jgi:hypothetical protein